MFTYARLLHWVIWPGNVLWRLILYPYNGILSLFYFCHNTVIGYLPQRDVKQLNKNIDKVLNVYSSSTECLYRIKRDTRVVYVLINDPEVIPEDSRTFGPDVIKELSKFPQWSAGWDTMTIDKNQTGLFVRLNDFKPHHLPEKLIRNDYPQFDILRLSILRRVKSRTLYTTVNGKPCYLKFARFDHELGPMVREIEAYLFLKDNNFTMIPEILGYVYEEPDRIIGVLLEDILGRHANIKDLELCKTALHELHKFIIHGDLNQYNIMITTNGPKFLDLEASCLKPPQKSVEWEVNAAHELQSLEAKLSDDSGEGRPFTIQ